jgi:hemoglobin-like flavoprotein
MFYVPKREKPATALYDDIIAWMHRSVGVRSDDFNRSLEALQKALVDLLDIEVDMECDEVIASSERFYDILDDLLLNGCDTITVLRRTERGLLVLASDSSARTDRRKLYFALGRGW